MEVFADGVVDQFRLLACHENIANEFLTMRRRDTRFFPIILVMLHIQIRSERERRSVVLEADGNRLKVIIESEGRGTKYNFAIF